MNLCSMHGLSQLKERFLDSPLHGIGLLHLLPNQCQSIDNDAKIPEDLLKTVDFYGFDLPHPALSQASAVLCA